MLCQQHLVNEGVTGIGFFHDYFHRAENKAKLFTDTHLRMSSG